MARGRKPDLNASSNVAVLQVEHAGDPEEPTEQHIEKSKSLRPTGMNAAERKIWNDLGPQMVRLGRLKAHFALAFRDFCEIEARLRHWRKLLDDKDWQYVTEGRNGQQYKARPQVAQLNDDWRKRHSLRSEFGLTPSAERTFSDVQADLFDDGWSDI
jgi:phage terminase small subunit